MTKTSGSSDLFRFWVWFNRGTGGKPGYRRLINRWLLIHAIIGASLATLIAAPLDQAANTVLLPIAGLLIGLSFAWGGNAQALLQTNEIQQLAKNNPGGFEDYVYTFQTAILLILLTLILWAFAGLGLFSKLMGGWGTGVKGTLYFFASMTVRECWHVVMGAQWMLLAQYRIKSAEKSGEK